MTDASFFGDERIEDARFMTRYSQLQDYKQKFEKEAWMDACVAALYLADDYARGLAIVDNAAKKNRGAVVDIQYYPEAKRKELLAHWAGDAESVRHDVQSYRDKLKQAETAGEPRTPQHATGVLAVSQASQLVSMIERRVREGLEPSQNLRAEVLEAQRPQTTVPAVVQHTPRRS